VTRAARLALALVAALAGAPACMTLDTQTDADYEGPQVYSGVRKDGKILTDPFMALQIPWMVIALADSPFSFLADTALLPVTIPRDAAAEQKRAKELEVETERPSPVKPVADEAPAATAQRLFETCESLLKDHDPHLSDCYSIDARVDVASAAPQSGAQYKPALRAALARDRTEGVLVEWRNPTFTADGERVRIEATRATSAAGTRSPVTLVVGPCADGGWRILEETGPGLSRE
jgi:uncharacterized protein YceK